MRLPHMFYFSAFTRLIQQVSLPLVESTEKCKLQMEKRNFELAWIATFSSNLPVYWSLAGPRRPFLKLVSVRMVANPNLRFSSKKWWWAQYTALSQYWMRVFHQKYFLKAKNHINFKLGNIWISIFWGCNFSVLKNYKLFHFKSKSTQQPTENLLKKLIHFSQTFYTCGKIFIHEVE